MRLLAARSRSTQLAMLASGLLVAAVPYSRAARPSRQKMAGPTRRSLFAGDGRPVRRCSSAFAQPVITAEAM